MTAWPSTLSHDTTEAESRETPMEWAEVGKGVAVILIVLYGLYSTLSARFLGTETSAQTAMLTEIKGAVVRVEERLQSMDDRHSTSDKRQERQEERHYKLEGRVESLEKWRESQKS